MLVYENDLLEEVNELSEKVGLKVWPNPFTSRLYIELQMEKKVLFTAEVYNLLGDRVAVIGEEGQTSGLPHFTWEAEDTPAGVYIIKITVENAAYSWKVMKLK